MQRASARSDTYSGNKYFSMLVNTLPPTTNTTICNYYTRLVDNLIQQDPDKYTPLFTGQIESWIQCDACNHKEHSIDEFTIIDLVATFALHKSCPKCLHATAHARATITRMPYTLATVNSNIRQSMILQNATYDLFGIACKHRVNHNYAVVKNQEEDEWYVFSNEHISSLKRSTHVGKPCVMFYNIRN